MSGIFAVYKPKGITSYEVIRRLKDKYPGEKIGHGGTLDPLAEGVLVIAVGRKFTKKLTAILKNTTKVYKATIELGKVSETDDEEGPIKKTPPLEIPSKKEITNIAKSFVGNIYQIPPRYSAVKIKGKPAYLLARTGVHFKLNGRKIKIFSIDIDKYKYPLLCLKITCASGVYIRALARDMGIKLKTGAYLRDLKRVAVGEYRIEKSSMLATI